MSPLMVVVVAIVLAALASGVAAIVVLERRARDGRLHVRFDESAEPMLLYDPTTLAFLDVNPAAIAAYGWTRDEFLRLHLTDVAVSDRSRAEPLADIHLRAVAAREWRHRRRDGSLRWMAVTTMSAEHRGRPAELSICHDVTERHEEEVRSRVILDHAAEAILTVGLDGRIESLNPAAERMFGVDGSDVVGGDISRLMAPSDPALRGAVEVQTGLRLGQEMVGRRPDGSTFPLELTVTDVELGDRTITTLVARDMTERKAFERRLTHQGTHDPLTGLPNRILFMDRLAHGIATAARTQRALAVLFCDLDRFKVVNDSLGHTAGDALLFAVAGRFRTAVRVSDTVARFGGDEFVILAEDLADADHAVLVAEKLAASLEEPVRIGSQEIHVSASIGIALAEPGATPETLLRDADAAMYQAKGGGKARHELFDRELRTQAMRRLDTESALRRGTVLQEFVVHFQPEVDVRTGAVAGMEALVRWDHPDHGLTPPGDFLPVAEETGLIVAIGEQVIGQACAQAAAWRQELRERAPTVWVNVSARQLSSPTLTTVVRRALETYGLTSSAIGIEITESDIVPDDDRCARTIQELVHLDVPIAIDDFGTGFASLSYLWRFPASTVKIDQTFVRRLDETPEAAALIEAMIQMAHSLGKTTVAEGVETETQLTQLRALGCDTVQGYLLGRPAPASEVLLPAM
jgi:diguanylate cyclase (GGDEF)-like protein/PAS domain S-box-containing protein